MSPSTVLTCGPLDSICIYLRGDTKNRSAVFARHVSTRHYGTREKMKERTAAEKRNTKQKRNQNKKKRAEPSNQWSCSVNFAGFEFSARPSPRWQQTNERRIAKADIFDCFLSRMVLDSFTQFNYKTVHASRKTGNVNDSVLIFKKWVTKRPKRRNLNKNQGLTAHTTKD